MADIVIVPNTDNPVQVNVSQQTQTISVSVPDINVVDISAGLTVTIDGNGGGSSTFLGLTDTPSSYTDQGDKFLAVNTNGTAITFVDAPTGSGDVTSLSLTDTPNGYGTEGQVLSVNSGLDGLGWSDKVSTLNDLSGAITLTEGNDNIVITPSGSSIILEVKPQQITEIVKNVSGGPLTKGTPLHITASSGNTSNVVAANANASVALECHYILNEDLADEAVGEAILVGFINNVNVPDASIFSNGDEVWLADGGGFTKTRPTGAGTLIQQIGVVLNVNTVNDNISGIVFGNAVKEDLPNLTSGYTWRGDANAHPQEYNLDALISLVNTNTGNTGTNADAIVALQAADITLQDNIDAEVANRQAADTNLNTSIIANTNSINAIKDRMFYSDAGGDDKVTVKPADSTVKIDIDGTRDVIEFTATNVKSTTISSTGVSTKGLTIDNGSNPFTLPTADGISNQVLTTDGSGNVTWDTKAFPNVSIAGLAAAGDHDINADKWFFGTGVTSAGRLIYLSSTGAWDGADASAASTAKGMISVAVGTNPSTDGVVIRGFIYLTNDAGGNVGDPVYLSETGGAVTTTAPTTSGAVVRVMGYKVATNIIYFNPSQDWIEIA